MIKAGNKGYGLQTTTPIPKGQFIIEYVGEVISTNTKEKRFEQYKTTGMLYILQLTKDFMIDARTKGGIARYINHSCNPNCTMEIWTVKGVKRAAVFPLRDLLPNEELTFDYEWELYPGRALTKCYCGESCCRGHLEKFDKGDLHQPEAGPTDREGNEGAWR